MENIPPSVKNFERKKNRITILSIDGGGIRGVIPAVILQCLEEQLQDIDNDKSVRIADYFDVIAGTSTGGLLAALLTAPDKNNRPLKTAEEIVKFYKEESPRIFPQTWRKLRKVKDYFNEMVYGPVYNGVYLHKLVRETVDDTKLHQTLTNLVIPTFDVKTLRPVIFSSFEIPDNPSLDAKLSDICIATSAAPTYLPSHYFENEGKKYNLIDGGIVNNNPTLLAMIEVSKQRSKEKIRHLMHDDEKLLIISIGTGTGTAAAKSTDCWYWRPISWITSQWGLLSWVQSIVDFLFEARADIVDIHNSVLFKKTNVHYEKYLRIQVDNLEGDVASLDVATEENLNDLETVGKGLLNKGVSQMNLETGRLEPDPNNTGLTNREALRRLAEELSKEKKFREKANMESQ